MHMAFALNYGVLQPLLFIAIELSVAYSAWLTVI